MNNELIDALNSVIESALKPIHSELKQLNQRIGNIETEIKDFRSETNTSMQVIQSGQQGAREEMTQRFKEIQHHLSHLESDITITYQKTAMNELELNRMKNH